MRNPTIMILIVCIILIIVAVFLLNTPEEQEQDVNTEVVSIIAENLYVPWSMAFLPSGELLVTERNGVLKLIGEKSTDIDVSGVSEVGEGGLLGLALHPDFNSNNFLYLYFTTRSDGRIVNRMVRYVFKDNILSEDKVITDNIPGGSIHNGGRIAFGPDGKIYITTGDAGNSSLSQDVNSLAGKILRLNSDGSIPSDNPFGNEVYSYGHRNPQGLTWDDAGRLWETEHGRSGLQSGLDEINLIEGGVNYGWPIIEGDEVQENMRSPVLHSGENVTWAPAGIDFKDGRLYFAGLRGKSLYEVEVLLEGFLGEVHESLSGKYGRLRGVIVGPDNNIYVTTSNKDGRGDSRQGDDKIIKIQYEK